MHWLKNHEQTNLKKPAINLSQEEIAAEYGSSPATVNKWLQHLQAANCVEQKKKGSYHVTDTGDKVIVKMKEIEMIIGGAKNG